MSEALETNPKHFQKRRGNLATLLSGHLLLLVLLALVSSGTDAEEIISPEKRPAPKGKSAFVYVIDTSSSMRWIFDEVKDTVKGAIQRRCGPEDSLSILLFGDTVKTLVSYKSVSDAKKEAVSRLLDSVHAESVYTNLGLALEKGTEHLHKYFLDETAEELVLILVSDGKDHPPPNYIRDYSFEETITQFPDFLPGSQWSLRYIVFKGQADPELLALVDKYGESFFDVEKIARLSEMTEKEVIKSIFETPEEWESIEPMIVDHDGDVKVKRRYIDMWLPLQKGKPRRLSVGDQVVVAPESKALISFGQIGQAGLQENSEISLDTLQKLPAQNVTAIQLRLEGGTLWNVVNAPPGGSLSYEVLTPIALTGIRGTVLRMSFDRQNRKQSIAVLKGSAQTTSIEKEPEFASFTLTEGTYSEIKPGETPSPPGPIPESILVEWGRWMKALVWNNPFSRINFETVKVKPLVDTIEIGPIISGKRFTTAFTVEFSEEYYGNEKISAKATIDLPPGAELKVNVIDVEDNMLEKKILISLECQPFMRYAGAEAHPGKIRLSCADPNVIFTRDYVDLQILHSRPGLFSLGRRLSTGERVLVLAIVSLITVSTSVLAWTKRKTLRDWAAMALSYVRDTLIKRKLIHFFRARPTGRIALDSAFAAGGQTQFDLARISLETDKVTVGIGTDPSNPICLTHPSVQPFHCVIRAGRKRNPTPIYIERSSDGHLAIKSEHIERIRQLHDGEVIEVGECQLRFIDVQLHQQVRVRMKDNTVHKGIIEVWNLDLNFFYLSEMIDDKEKSISLRFDEVSHIHFYRDESERSIENVPHPLRDRRSKHRKAVTITLVTNRKLKGFVDKRYHYDKESSGVFLMPPPGNVDIQYTYIPRTSIKTVIIENPK